MWSRGHWHPCWRSVFRYALGSAVLSTLPWRLVHCMTTQEKDLSGAYALWRDMQHKFNIAPDRNSTVAVRDCMCAFIGLAII